MKIIGIGIDLVSVQRISKAIEKNPEQFLKKTFTELEQKYSSTKKKSACHFAARFAAKEAIMKATGSGWNEELSWLDIEVYNKENGRPGIRFLNKGQLMEEEMGITEVHISLSHTDEMATAVVVLIG